MSDPKNAAFDADRGEDSEATTLDELNPDGVGGTTGEANTFEPEEEPDAEHDDTTP